MSPVSASAPETLQSYDAELPGGTVRFAEFSTYQDSVIERLFLHYNGPDYLAKGGR